MRNIAVIMSTYNGELYVKQQIDSVLSQENINVNIYIRDDGSTDSTPIILHELESAFNNIHVVYDKNIGIGNSFMEMLYTVPDIYDYYAFADQDDFWLPEKLYKALEKIETFDIPALYASNQLIVDEALNQLGMRFCSPPGIRYGDIVRGNLISGCTFVFNKELFRILINIYNRPSTELLVNRIHDAWVAMIAALFGKIIYDSESYILYRQHSHNAVGAKQSRSIDRWKLRFKRLITKDSCLNGRIMSTELINIFAGQLGEKEPAILAYSLYSKNIKHKLALINYSSIFAHKGENKILYILKIIVNRL